MALNLTIEAKYNLIFIVFKKKPKWNNQEQCEYIEDQTNNWYKNH